MGARIRTPATSVSNARSYSPSKCDTSVDVPPMSKPMRRSRPGLPSGFRHSDHAAGGPDKDRILALEQFGSRSVRRTTS
mgnify:CR=1 FL=1